MGFSSTNRSESDISSTRPRRGSSGSNCSTFASRHSGASISACSSQRLARFSDFYTVGAAIGMGSFAKVHKCFHRLTGRAYAVKIIQVSSCRNSAPKAGGTTTFSAAMDELRVCSSLKGCAGILQLREAFKEPSPDSRSVIVFAVFELAEGGELTQAVDERGSLPEEDSRGILKSLFQACDGMHRRGVVHRDIKLDNILLQHKHVFDSGVKLADLGMAAITKSSHKLQQMCGTPMYMAPEILEVYRHRRDAAAAGANEMPSSVGYGAEVDMWSCGVVLYIILCGFPPFSSKDSCELFAQILSGSFSFTDPAWEMVSSDAQDLVTRCLTTDPAARITAEEALQHPWILQT